MLQRCELSPEFLNRASCDSSSMSLLAFPPHTQTSFLFFSFFPLFFNQKHNIRLQRELWHGAWLLSSHPLSRDTGQRCAELFIALSVAPSLNPPTLSSEAGPSWCLAPLWLPPIAAFFSHSVCVSCTLGTIPTLLKKLEIYSIWLESASFHKLPCWPVAVQHLLDELPYKM